MSAPDDARVRILIVDDEHYIVTELGFYLSKRGFEVLYGDCGETALALLAQQGGQTLTHMIVDLRMPQMDGFELISRIDREQFRELTLIAVSGHASSEDEARALNLGADHFLAKPYSLQRLLSIIRGSNTP